MAVVYPHIRTSADVLQSTIRLQELMPFLQQQHAEACAIVNSKLYGLMPFWRSMKEAGIHAVIGLSVYVQWHDDVILPLVVYAKTTEGYRNLLKMSSAASIHKNHVLPLRWFTAYAKGCMTLVPLLHHDWLSKIDEAFFAQLVNLLGIHALVVGVARPAGIIHEREEEVVALCANYHCTIVATQPSQFLRPNDFTAFQVARAIELGVRLEDMDNDTDDRFYYVPDAETFQRWFIDRPQWLEATRQLLLNCQVEMPVNHTRMPTFPLQQGQTAEQLLTTQVLAGLQSRLQTTHIPETYMSRLQYELDVICKMGYADYFLIVADFLAFARKEHILTGPGRGSSASSLVAYALQITKVDPLQYGLLFERFLNPERVSLPDIDIDFVDFKRQKVIQYVANKYGHSHVAQIITFGTLSAKAVARDVARVFSFEAEKIQFIASQIPNKQGITLQEAYEQSQQLRQWITQDERHQQWFDIANKLEGLPRNASTHAAGVVLSPQSLVDIVPIEQGHEEIYLTQWPMQDIESMGLLKMDFLGLRTLTILEQIRLSIYNEQGKWIEFEQIPLDDVKTFQLLQSGDTAGVFQLESDGMKQALRDIKPTHFLDIVAVNALYRPGPMDFIAVYARRKHGMEQVVVPHPILAPILQETYGVIVYQEQIMKIAVVMAGFTFGQADLLRRAVSKKKREVLEEQRQVFVKGAVIQGYTETIADEVYALIVRFADYGFPKSHAVAYSMISYQMAYVKANEPAHFYAALMSNALGNADKIHSLMMEAKERGIQILPLSIEKSLRNFTAKKGAIRMGLSAIKNVPAPFLTQLLSLRKQHPKAFQNLFDMAVCLSGSYFKRKALEPLIYAGALDDFGRDRATLLASLDAAVKHTELVRPSEDIDYASALKMAFGKPKYIEVPPMSEKEKLLHEREYVGFYLSEHPITKERLKWPRVNCHIKNIKQLREGATVCFVGLIEEVKKIRTKKGEQMAFVVAEDEYGSISVTLFPQVFDTASPWLVEGMVVYIEGVLEFRFGKSQIKAKNITLSKER